VLPTTSITDLFMLHPRSCLARTYEGRFRHARKHLLRADAGSNILSSLRPSLRDGWQRFHAFKPLARFVSVNTMPVAVGVPPSPIGVDANWPHVTAHPRGFGMNWMFYAIVILLLIVATGFVIGPRVAMDGAVSFDRAGNGDDPEKYLAAREAGFGNIRDGLAKEIVWADPKQRGRTPLAIVYVHGFSASKGEIRPLPDKVAASLGANLFYTRLAGHGQDGPALATGSVNDWIDDMAEAIAIGEEIGERVVVIATSTGGALATWAASRPEFADRMEALVLISPNYRLRGTGAGLLTGPWGGQLARLFLGPENGFEPANPLQSHLWTNVYPTKAILPMAAMVEMARRVPVESIHMPTLFLFSDDDKVVDPSATRAVVSRWGGPAETILVEDADDPNRHVITGEAYSPSTTDRLSVAVTDWLRSTLK
jgi:alpha-beta hydrolase superfamily lysophospholipase